MSAAFDLEGLAAALRRGGPSRRLEVREEVGSTQEVAFTLAEYGAPDGSVVLAERQTRGRGRLGRTWDSPAGVGLWFSVILRPPADPVPNPALLVAATAVAAAEAVERAGGFRPGIRWPNDLVAGDRKLAGILLETRDFEPAAPLFVLGVGLNVGHRSGDFPPGLRAEATSLYLETGSAPDRTALLAAVFESLDRWRARLASGAHAAVEEAFRDRAAYLGRQVSVLEGSTPLAGVLEAVSAVDGVTLRLPDGSLRTVRPEHARDLRPGPGPGAGP